MAPFVKFLSAPEWDHLAVALLHTLWQAIIVAGLLFVVLKCVSANYSRLRYLLALSAQVSVLILGLSTWSWMNLESLDTTPTAKNSSQPKTVVTTEHATQPVDSARITERLKPAATAEHAAIPSAIEFSSWKETLVGVWLLGVFTMLARLSIQLAGVRMLVRSATPVPDSIISVVNELRAKLSIRGSIRTVAQESLDSPVVVGIIWPTLILPVSMLTGLGPDVLRLVLAHELSHIRRHDYFINVLQKLIEAILFFNPTVFWISRQVTAEREACCDACAVAITGRPIEYATVLADWAERISTAVSREPAVAFSGRNKNSLLDRVQRILTPTARPQIKVSWQALLAVLAVSTVFLALLGTGTNQVVAIAAQLLSPQERLQQLVETRDEIAPIPKAGTKATFSGTIETEDGHPFSGDIKVSYYNRSHSGNVILGTAGNYKAEKFDDTFSYSFSPGTTWFIVYSEGYAPSIVGPYQGKNDEPLENIKIVLTKGFSSAVRVVDENGTPVSAAECNASPEISAGTTVGSGQTWTSNTEGIFNVTHAIDRIYSISVKKPGYQPMRTNKNRLKPNGTLTVVLKKTKPISGTIVSYLGDPVPNAKIKEFVKVQVELHNSQLYGQSGATLGTTNAQGQFELNELEDGWNYYFLVESEKFGKTVIQKVETGTRNLKIKIGPKISLKGRVLGDLSSLELYRKKPILKLTQLVEVNGRSETRVTDRVPVKVTDDEGHFEIRGMLPGRFSLKSAGRMIRGTISESVDDFVFDLDQSTSQLVFRQVVLKFVPQQGDLPPEGHFSIFTYAEGDDLPPKEQKLEIKNGEAKFDSYVPGRFTIHNQKLVGAWFDTNDLYRDRGAYVDLGEKPHVVEIPVLPAGAISGRALNWDGSSESGNISVSVNSHFQLESGQNSQDNLNNIKLNARGEFFASPIPFGAKCTVKISNGHNLQISDPVLIDAEHPTRTVNLQLPKPILAVGQVVNEQGRPVPNLAVELHHEHSAGGHSWSPDVWTDKQGRFQFDNINAEVGKYWANIDSKKDWQPARIRLRTDGRPVKLVVQEGLVVEGTVIDSQTGKPVPGIEVYASPVPFSISFPTHYEAEAKTDSEGRYRFSNLPNKKIKLGARGIKRDDGYVDNIQPSQTVDVEIRGTVSDWLLKNLR